MHSIEKYKLQWTEWLFQFDEFTAYNNCIKLRLYVQQQKINLCIKIFENRHFYLWSTFITV